MDKKYYFWLLNIVLPIVFGAVFYTIAAPDVFFVQKVNNLFHINIVGSIDIDSFLILKIMRCHLLDMLWGYSLVFSVALIILESKQNIKMVFMISCMFSVLVEMSQMSSLIVGTFDFWDIIVEVVAEVIAIIIIQNHFYHEEVNGV